MDKQKAIEILEDALHIWNALNWFNDKHNSEARIYFGSMQLVDEIIPWDPGCLAEDIADALHLTRTYTPWGDGSGHGLCKISYKGHEFFSGWRDCK